MNLNQKTPPKTYKLRTLGRHFIFFAVFVLIFILFLFALQKGDPSSLPSVLINKHVPAFSLPPLRINHLENGFNGFDASDLKKGDLSLLNIWASWCVPCREEHPALMSLALAGVPIYGLNYKDKPEAAIRFLSGLGNPYKKIGMDKDGRVAIGFGVYGVPETFVIDGDGKILHRHIGPLTQEIIAEVLLPMLGISYE